MYNSVDVEYLADLFTSDLKKFINENTKLIKIKN